MNTIMTTIFVGIVVVLLVAVPFLESVYWAQRVASLEDDTNKD